MKDGNTVVYRKTLSRRRWRGYSRIRRKQGTHEIVRLESETTPDSASAGWFPSRVPQTQIGRSPELREGGVLEGLGGAQAHHGRGLDLDGLAGHTIAKRARQRKGKAQKTLKKCGFRGTRPREAAWGSGFCTVSGAENHPPPLRIAVKRGGIPRDTRKLGRRNKER